MAPHGLPTDRLRELMWAADSPPTDKDRAKSVGLSPAYWSNVKSGKKSDVELISAAKILLGLGLDWSALGSPGEQIRR